MGTSQAFKLNSGPNWAKAKRAITSIVNEKGNASNNMTSLMRGINKGLGDSLYRGAGSRHGGSSYAFGKAGGNRLNDFISFINSVNQNGLAVTLGLQNDQLKKLSPKEYIDLILRHVTDDNNSNLDDTAATVAMDTLLHEILDDCEDDQEIEDRLIKASKDDQIKWIIAYEVAYIMEYSAELFQSHIFDKEGDPEKVRIEIENWLKKEIDENFSEDLSQINLNSDAGKEKIDKLTSEILDIWEQ